MAQNVALLRFSCFLTPIWPETLGLRLPFCNQQCDNANTHLQKEIWLKNAIFLSILSFQVEKKNQLFFYRMCTLFLLDNQVCFILANMWIFTWKSKHKNIFGKEKGKRRKWSNQCLQVALFHDFHSNKIGHSSRSSSIQRSKTTEEVSGNDKQFWKI